jgi:hypothetical protein
MAVTINIPSQVKTYANLAAFPASGSLKTIYIAEDTNKTYRWTGSVYVEISGADFSGYVPTSRTLTINGVAQDLSADRSWTISTGLTVGTTPISSGTIGRVLFEGTGNVLQQSSSLFWDSTNNRLGIGTSTPARALDIVKTIASGAIEGVKIEVNHNSSTSAAILDFVHTQFDARARIQSIAGAGGANPTLSFIIRSTTAMSILQSGNVNIGNTTTDAGFRLDVNGTARVQGNTTIVGTSLSSFSVSNGATAMIQTASSGIGSSDFRLRLFNNGNTQTLDLYGSGDYDHQSRHAFRTNGTERMRIFSTGNVLINTTTDAGFKLDVNGTARVSGNLYIGNTQNQFASLNPYLFFQRGAGNGLMFTPVNAINAASQNGVVIMDSIYGYVTYAGGTHTFNALSINTNINTGGSYNGIIRGFYYNPTLTSMTGVTHYAIHTTSGRIRFENLPTSSAGLSAGDIWNDGGTLKIV